MSLPSRLIITAGTYDGVLVGWDTEKHDTITPQTQAQLKQNDDDISSSLHMSFAMSAHDGSVRSLCIAGTTPAPSKQSKKSPAQPGLAQPGILVSAGFDETIRVLDLKRHREAGETKTPQDLGTPTTTAFCPPGQGTIASPILPTHLLVGLSSGKLALYKRSDWSVAHVLSGHTGGAVSCCAVHPSGKMALSGGRDGTLRLWDLMRGRLAFVHRLSNKKEGEVVEKDKDKEEGSKKTLPVTVAQVVWSGDGSRFAFCHGMKVTARDALTGEDLVDIVLPARTNDITFIGGPTGPYLACACDDGSLPVLGVGKHENDKDEEQAIRAVMAIEGVDRVVVGNDRFKCIEVVSCEADDDGGDDADDDGDADDFSKHPGWFQVVTANSGGVVSVMDLRGAVNMITHPSEVEAPPKPDKNNDKNKESNEDDDDYYEDSESDDDSEDEELAVDILTSVRVGSGARITSIAVWSCQQPEPQLDEPIEEIDTTDQVEEMNDVSPTKSKDDEQSKLNDNKRARIDIEEMDYEDVQKARLLVSQAKKRQKRKDKKKKQKLAKTTAKD
mmetsp:Transcript_628/g.742  ORF Transcript_628/g.742 Transcript_628/m.742 type:complete len:556 (+) Transcript_628:156-1823(+)